MARMTYLNLLKCKEKSALEFNFDTLLLPSMYNWIQPYQISSLYNIATSAKYSANVKKKYAAIDEIMTKCGCRKLHAGTNRIAYVPYECKDICFKIAIDNVGMKDNPAEFQNQNVLKPFVTKLTEVHPSGVISTVERVLPIMSIEEFESIAPDIFDMLVNKILGKYIMEDIGTKYFMNYGIRPGWGPVLLDFPYLFELDGARLYCNDMMSGYPCGGQIDYDPGFNTLLCTKCGKLYNAKSLAKSFSDNKIQIIKRGVNLKMRSVIMRGNEEVRVYDGGTNNITVKNEKQSNSVMSSGKIIRNGNNQQRNNNSNNKPQDNQKKQQEQREKEQEYTPTKERLKELGLEAVHETKEIQPPELSVIPAEQEVQSEKKEDIPVEEKSTGNVMSMY